MLSEYRVVFDSDDIIHIIRVVLFQIVKNLKFNTSLVMEPLFVSNYLQCDELIGFVIVAFQSLTETTFS